MAEGNQNGFYTRLATAQGSSPSLHWTPETRTRIIGIQLLPRLLRR